MANKRQLRRETKLLALALKPRMNEFFDRWLVIGIRAGDHNVASTVDCGIKSETAQTRLENEILAIASDICVRRKKIRQAR